MKSVRGWLARAAMDVESSMPGAAYIPRDDLIGYAAVGLCVARQRYRPDSGASFKTFAWARVRGAIIDGVRSEYRRGPKHLPAYYRHVQAVAASPPDPLQLVLRRERDRVVREALAALSEADRRFLLAVVVEEKSLEEAGAEIGITRSGACRRLKSILARCRAEMEAFECR